MRYKLAKTILIVFCFILNIPLFKVLYEMYKVSPLFLFIGLGSMLMITLVVWAFLVVFLDKLTK